MAKGSADRSQVRTAVGFGAVFIAAIVAAVVANALRSEPPGTPVPSPSGIATNTCTGQTPPAPFRSPGPFPPPPQDATDPELIYVARISTYCGDLLFKIDPLDAPETARSFIFLSRVKFFDGLVFDRVEPGFGLFGGKGRPGYTVKVAKRGRAPKAGDLVMADMDESANISVASSFGVSDGAAAGTIFLGAPPDDDAVRANRDTLERFFALVRSGPVALPPLYIVHIGIEEFSRE